MFVPITDPDKAFALHQAGLLWWKASPSWTLKELERTDSCWSRPDYRDTFITCVGQGKFGIIVED